MKSTPTVQKRITVKAVKQEHILSCDIDNAYFQRVEDTLNDSSTAKRCASTCAKFLMGGGFLDSDFYKAVINRKGLTTDKLLRLIAKDFSFLPGFAMHVNFNALFDITEVNFIPYGWCRLTDTEDVDSYYHEKIAVYNDWGRVLKKKIETKEVVFIDKLNLNPEVIQQQVDRLTIYEKDGKTVKTDGWNLYKGQIYAHGMMDGFYELAPCDAVLEDMMTQGKMKRFKFNSVDNNFLTSHVITVPKFENDEKKDEFVKSLTHFQGAENTGGMLLLEKESEEDVIKLDKVDIQDYDGLYDYTETSVKTEIRESWFIPEVFVSSASASIGGSNEIKDATALYNGMTADQRLVIEEVFKMIFERFHQPINPSGDYSIIPFKAPVSTLEIDPTNSASLIDLVTSQILERNQKIQLLNTIYSISEEDANKMLGL